MTTVDETAVADALLHDDEIVAGVQGQTLAILERRRRTAKVHRRGWLVRRMLVLADVLGLSIAFLLAEVLVRKHGPVDHLQLWSEYLIFFASLPGWIVLAKLYGLYEHDEERTDHSTTDDFVAVVHLVTISTAVLFVVTHVGVFAPTLWKVVCFWALAISLVTVNRISARALCRRHVAYLQNVVIVGAGVVGQLAARKILRHPEYGMNLVGFVDPAPLDRHPEVAGVPYLGHPDRLPTIVRLFDVERVVLSFSGQSHAEDLALIRSLKDLDVQVDIVPRLFEIVGTRLGIHTIEGLPLLGLPPLRLSHSSRFLKRFIDFGLSGLGLVILSPLFAFIALRIKKESPGPVFFRQVRMGHRNHTFSIHKFRTMYVDAEARKQEIAHLNMHSRANGDPRMFKAPNDPRVTRFGAVLRRYSLDELPQLIDVFRGEMSLVGPRPLILSEDEHVNEWARKRLDLKPGITGLWQVLGRSEIPFQEMTNLDYIYVTNWSLWGDLRLLFLTLPALLRTRRAY